MNKKKLIELFIYVAIVVIGIILLITSNNDKKEMFNNVSEQGGTSYAVVSNEQ